MALEFIIEYGKTFNAILFCVDSKAALQAIKSHRLTDRGEIVFQIKHLVHQLIIRGSIVNFLWVPSHTGLLYNDWADRAAKRGSKNVDSVTLNLSLSKNEIYTILKSSKTFQHNNPNQIHCKLTSDTSNSIPWAIRSLAHRLILNSWYTKFSPNIVCPCGTKISIEHILKECQIVVQKLNGKNITVSSIADIDYKTWISIASVLSELEIYKFL